MSLRVRLRAAVRAVLGRPDPKPDIAGALAILRALRQEFHGRRRRLEVEFGQRAHQWPEYIELMDHIDELGASIEALDPTDAQP